MISKACTASQTPESALLLLPHTHFTSMHHNAMQMNHTAVTVGRAHTVDSLRS